MFPPLPVVEFDGTSLSLHSDNPGPINSKSDFSRDQRKSDAEINRQSSNTDGRITAADRRAPRCTTPEGGRGHCVDLQDCPILLVNFNNLRKSICFKELFVPGVCCPDKG